MLISLKNIAGPQPVVSNLKDEGLIVGVVGKRCDGHIVVHVDAQACCPALRGVGLALIHEGLGHLAHVAVEDTLQTVHPCGSELAAAILVDGADIAAQ